MLVAVGSVLRQGKIVEKEKKREQSAGRALKQEGVWSNTET